MSRGPILLSVTQTWRDMEYELSSVTIEEVKVLGTVADLPWTLPEMVKDVLWDNTQSGTQQRFGHKWLDGKPVGCHPHKLLFTKWGERSDKSLPVMYRGNPTPRWKEHHDIRSNCPGKANRQEFGQKWNDDRLRNCSCHEWPYAKQRATHTKTLNVVECRHLM